MFALVNFSNILFILRVKEFLLHVVLKKKQKQKTNVGGSHILEKSPVLKNGQTWPQLQNRHFC